MASNVTQPNPRSSALFESANPSTASENVTIFCDGFEKIWRPTLVEVWDEGFLADMTIRAATTKFRVHRLTMLSYSFFRKKIREAAQDDRHWEVTVDLDPVMVKKVLEFIYVGKVDVVRSQMEELATAADKLGVVNLRNIVVTRQLEGTEVTAENCLSLWQSASKEGYKECIDKCKLLALENFPSLQHSEDFKALSASLVVEYLKSKGLKARRAEERLLAALYWIKADPSPRHRHLSLMVDHLPLDQMGWFLDHALHEPLISDSPEVKKKVELAKAKFEGHGKVLQEDNVGKEPESKKKGDKGSVMPVKPVVKRGNATDYSTWSSRPQTSLVLTDDLRAIHLVFVLNLQHSMQLTDYGRITAKTTAGTSCCILGPNLYTSFHGSGGNEIWKFDLQRKKGTLLTRVKIPRMNHAMVAHQNGLIYILGGGSPTGFPADVEMVDPATGKCQEVGQIRHYNPLFVKKCCVLQSGDLAIAGSMGSDFTTMLEVWSPNTCTTRAAISLGKRLGSVYGILQSGDNIIIVADVDTLVCKLDDVLHEIHSGVSVSDKYKAPNEGCAVVFTPQQDHILLVAGKKRVSATGFHFIYKASVHDVVNNTVAGWRAVADEEGVESWYVYGYATTHLSLLGQ